MINKYAFFGFGLISASALCNRVSVHRLLVVDSVLGSFAESTRVGFARQNCLFSWRQGVSSWKPVACSVENCSKMAESTVNSTHSTPIPRVDRGEVDARPMESVKAAVSLFGESVFEQLDGRKPKIPFGERKLAKEADVHLVQEQFAKSKEQLKNAEAVKAQAQLEVEIAKKILEELTDKLEEAKKSKEKATKVSTMAKQRVEELEAANKQIPWGCNKVLQAELNAERERHMMVSAELEAIKQELGEVKQELAASMGAKELALKQAGEATIAAETNNNRAEELVKEIAAANESLVLAQLACMEAEKDRAAILAEKETEAQKAAELVEQTSQQLETLSKQLDAAKDLETKLTETTTTVENLQTELCLAKESEAKAAKAASDANENLNELKEEIAKINEAASDAEASLKSTTAELEDTKENLKKATEECISLKDTVDFLRADLEQVKKELAELKEREAEAEVSVAILNSELHQSKSKLAASAAAEAKAKGANVGLSLALKQLATEAEAAKKEAKASKEEVRIAKLEAEQAKADMNNAETRLQDALKEAEQAKSDMNDSETRLQDALKEAEAAKAAETTALAERDTARTESMNASDFYGGITISQEEYDCLNRKVEEADELADNKVAAALAHVDAVKAGDQQLLKKLEMANIEIEELKSVAEQAIYRAEMAETAKRSVEGELRKWREREQRKRAAALAAAKDLVPNGNSDVPKTFVPDKTQHYEPLSKVLNIKTSSQNLEGSQATDIKKKKQLIGGMFGKKKNQVDDIYQSNQLSG
eukprot:Gb_22717 [translate_table: standard]